MSGETVLVTRDGAVATITLNRPEVYNATNGAMAAALAAAVRECAACRRPRETEGI
jgi:enoyl-CoA hydratase/carnithine racemase